MKGDVYYFIQKIFKNFTTRLMILIVTEVDNDKIVVERINMLKMTKDLLDNRREYSKQKFKELIESLEADSSYSYKINSRKMLNMLFGNTEYINLSLAIDLYRKSNFYSNIINSNLEKIHRDLQAVVIDEII